MSETPGVEENLEEHTLILHGAWTLAHYQTAKTILNSVKSSQIKILDGRYLKRLDSSAVFLLYKKFGAQVLAAAQLSERHAALVNLVIKSCSEKAANKPSKQNDFFAMLGAVGVFSENLWKQQKLLLGFMGLTLSRLFENMFRPRRWRGIALMAQIEQVGLNAVPIIALLTFLVGAVVAFLGATVLQEFGATIYTVNLVGFSFLREFGVLLTAILLAGRTASAFTAQVGAMKANEEIDAIRAQGLDPIELLVIPRIIAMLISLPALTLLAMFCGVLGGATVSWLALDISPQLFFHIFARDIDISNFWVGLIKAPVFAFIIALIGCLEGFKVSGSAQSVGEHTTSSVVQSIFSVILLDALFAIFFMELGW